jgi:aspartyl-tRNA(Asn)/glutamyl-tRNA(Gln) amidotransferase subunit A
MSKKLSLPETIKQAADELRQGVYSAVELTQAYLHQIEAVEPDVHAIITVTADKALDQAREADARIATGSANMLTGIPLIHKDNFSTLGVRTTAGSTMLTNYNGQYDATVVSRLRQVGMVMLGKSNLDAFAHGSSTENSDFGPSFNPWDTAYVPGGSSGGSAAAVAAGESLVATGSDTGGSIRLPASFTNTVGLKPTYGRVSRYGVLAMGSSFDSIGHFTRTVEDNAMVLQAIAGHDPNDATTPNTPVPDYLGGIDKPLDGVTLGLVEEFFGEGLDPSIAAVVAEARQVYERLGVTFKKVHLPNAKYALAAYYILVPSELSSNLSRLDGIRYGYSDPTATSLLEMYELSRAGGFGAEAKRRIMLGTYALSAGYYDAYYKRAQQVRTLVKQDFDVVFTEVDGLLAPVSPTLPFKVGEKVDDVLAMYLTDILTVPMNLAGVPSLALPAGFVGSLPVGMQLIGPHFSEDRLYNWGHKYQMETAWHANRSPLMRKSEQVEEKP